MKKIVICGGHLTPALALIEELTPPGSSDLKIFFFGRKYSAEGSNNLSLEFQEINKRDIRFIQITAGRLQRKLTRFTFLSILKIPIGFLESFLYLMKIRPDLIISFGGYLSPPVVFCGWLLGIDSIIHEQTSNPGLANRFNSLFAKKIFLTWPQTKKYFDSSKSKVIGNLARKSLFNKSPRNKEISDFIKRSKNYIFITGGNQGSHFINRLIHNSQLMLKNYKLIHQLGTINYKNDHEQAQKLKKSNYLPLPLVGPDDIGLVIANSSFVIARSGANTVWELAILKKPSILIPLPISANQEQNSNAQILKEAGSALLLDQKNLTPDLLTNQVEKISRKLPKYEKSAQEFSKTLPKDSAKILANFIITNY